MLADDAPWKFAAVNSPLAGSLVSTLNEICGTSIEFFAQMSYCVNVPPMLMLCAPFSQVRVSSTSVLFALRDCGEGAGPGLCRLELTDGNRRENPCCGTSEPVNIPTFSSSKNFTGAPL